MESSTTAPSDAGALSPGSGFSSTVLLGGRDQTLAAVMESEDPESIEQVIAALQTRKLQKQMELAEEAALKAAETEEAKAELAFAAERERERSKS